MQTNHDNTAKGLSMGTIWIVLGLLAAALLLVVILAFTKPDSYTVERRTSIQAKADDVYALMIDFRQWPKWSPWEHLDPAMTRTHEGPQSGVGSVYSWTGNSKVGAGRMEIVSAVSPQRIDIKLDFLRPFKAQNSTAYSLKSNGDATEVVWTMTGPMLFISKLMSVFMSMDKMIGKDFELGLRQLKAQVEGPAR